MLDVVLRKVKHAKFVHLFQYQTVYSIYRNDNLSKPTLFSFCTLQSRIIPGDDISNFYRMLGNAISQSSEANKFTLEWHLQLNTRNKGWRQGAATIIFTLASFSITSVLVLQESKGLLMKQGRLV